MDINILPQIVQNDFGILNLQNANFFFIICKHQIIIFFKKSTKRWKKNANSFPGSPPQQPKERKSNIQKLSAINLWAQVVPTEGDIQ